MAYPRPYATVHEAVWEQDTRSYISRKIVLWWDLNAWGKYVLLSSHTYGQYFAASVFEVPNKEDQDY